MSDGGSKRAGNDGSGSDAARGEPDRDKVDIGAALRTVYDDAASEDIPSEMLDLLGKLS